MPKAIKKRIIKHAKTEEEVKGSILKAKQLAIEKKKTLITLAGVIVISAAAIGGFFIYSSSIKSRAEKLEYEAYKIYYGLYQKQPITKEEQYRMARETFKKAYDTKKSSLSLFYIANCYYEMGKYDDAVNTLKDLNQKFPDDERFVPLSYYKMAMASIKKGDRNEALKFLDTLYNYKTVAFKDLALIESGRILEAMGRGEDAKRRYEELTKSFPGSPFIEEARAKLGEKKD